MGVLLSYCLGFDYRSRYGHCLPEYLDRSPTGNNVEQLGDCIETFVDLILKGPTLATLSPRRHPDMAMELYEIPTPRYHRRIRSSHHQNQSQRNYVLERLYSELRLLLPTFLYS